MSLHILTRKVPRLLGLTLVSLAFARVDVHRLPPHRFLYLGVFPSRSYSHVVIDFSCFFFTTGVSASIGRPSLAHFLGQFPSLGLALVPDVVVQRRVLHVELRNIYRV